MGLPRRTVEFGASRDKPETYVEWDNILYMPELFPPSEHTHPEVMQDVFNNLIQVVQDVPSITKKGQLFLIRK